MAKQRPETPLLDQLEGGPWPSFVSGLKRLADEEGKQYAPIMKSLLGQLEHSYDTRKGYWKGGTVGVRGYGGGIIPRFSEVAGKYPESAEFHTMRVMPPAGMHYDTKTLRDLCDIWAKWGSGLIAFHGQSGDIMFQGISSANIQSCFDEQLLAKSVLVKNPSEKFERSTSTTRTTGVQLMHSPLGLLWT